MGRVVRRAGEFERVRQIRAAHRDAGGLWFDTAVRTFGTRVHDVVYAGRYFVTSEADPLGVTYDGERRFTVRCVRDDLTIATRGSFMEFETAAEAHAAARERSTR